MLRHQGNGAAKKSSPLALGVQFGVVGLAEKRSGLPREAEQTSMLWSAIYFIHAVAGQLDFERILPGGTPGAALTEDTVLKQDSDQRSR